MRDRVLVALCMALLFALPTLAQADGHDFGRSVETQLAPQLSWIATEKIRGSYNWSAPPELYEAAKASGLNAIISRLDIANDPSGDVGLRKSLQPGATKPIALRCYDLVQPSSRRAKELGLHWFFMLNPGAFKENFDDGLRDHSRRHNNGWNFAATDDIFWTRVIENRFLRVAEMLRGDEYQIDGFMIDPEMYAHDGARPPGGTDYGDFALAQFTEHSALTFAYQELSIAQRRAWISHRGLIKQLAQFQFQRIKALAQRTRQRIQAIHPDALFGSLLWGDSLWDKALAAGFSTPRAPYMVLPEQTYPGEYSQAFLQLQDRVRREAQVPILFVPGVGIKRYTGTVLTATEAATRMKIMPANVYNQVIRSQGYWIYHLTQLENPEARDDFLTLTGTVHAELDRYLAADGDYESALTPGPLPIGTPIHIEQVLRDARAWQWSPLPARALPVKPPPATGWSFRGLNTFVLAARSGDRFEFDIAHAQVGTYRSPISVTVHKPDSSQVAYDPIPVRGSRTLVVNIDQPGTWVVAIDAGRNACLLNTRGPASVLYNPDGSTAIWGKRDTVLRYFFYVPETTTQFVFKPSAYGQEDATFRLFDPQGKLIVEEKNLTHPVAHRIDARKLAGKVSWIEVSDIMEDCAFGLVGIPTILVTQPDQLIVPSKRGDE
jgi:hypothetical protein